MQHEVQTLRHNTTDDATPQAGRRTVIPTPRSGAMFPGWGVRF